MTNAEMEIKKVLDKKCGYVPGEFFVLKMQDILGIDNGIGMIVAGGCENGAYAIFDADIREKVAALIGERFYCIPSSIHEFICLPEDFGGGWCEPKALVSIIRQVNETEVDPEDRLSDKLYFFNGKEIEYA